MQTLARGFGEDTSFVLRPTQPRADVRIRYFVPDHEMGISGHATIAALTVALSEEVLRPGRLRIETVSGVFDATAIRTSADSSVTLEQNEPIFGGTADRDLVARVLRIPREEVDLSGGPIQAVSVSRAKLLVPIRTREVLDRLTPNYEALWELCEALNVSGLYPFVRGTGKSGAHAQARQFPLRAGFLEDAATGVAAVALGAYLTRHDLNSAEGQHELRIAQGYAMGRPSLIEVLTHCAQGRFIRTAMRGTAEVVRYEDAVA